MIRINITPPDFEYDIQSLVMAFFPGEKTVINNHGKTDESEKLCVNAELKNNKVNIFIMSGKELSQDKNIKLSKNTEIESLSENGGIILHDSIETDFSDRKMTKNDLKKLLYKMLGELSGKSLPWGTLTGIRPVKIPLMLLESGWTDFRVKQYMKDTYAVSDKKADLSIDIAKHELDILSRIDYKNGYSVYIGIPFCPTTCLYCSFTSYPISTYAEKTDDYLKALFKEIEYTGSRFKNKYVNTVYIGGGTPTTLTAEQLDRLLDKIEVTFDLSKCIEITVEAGRPDSITEEKLKIIKKHKVTRISINPQTMNQKTLDLIGRKHTVEHVKDTFRLARECGMDNINMDFIAGLPDEHFDDVKYSMEETEKLSPDSITVHSLAIKRAARINMFKEDYKGLDIDNSNKIMDMVCMFAKKMGMSPYYLYRQKNMAGNLENVGYAKKGKEGIYNILIMEQKQTIVALGAGSVTRFAIPGRESFDRVSNLKNVDQYIDRIDEMINRKDDFISANPQVLLKNNN